MTDQEDQIERLLLEYTFGGIGAISPINANPYRIAPNQLIRAIIAWTQAQGNVAPSEDALKNYLTDQKYRFAPRWLMLCSAMARELPRDYDYRTCFEDPSTVDTDTLIHKIYDNARKNNDADNCLMGQVPRGEAFDGMKWIMREDRYAIWEYTSPLLMLENMSAWEKMHPYEFSRFILPRDCVQRCMWQHGFSAWHGELIESLTYYVTDRPRCYHVALPLWARNIVEYARTQTDGKGNHLRNVDDERLQGLIDWPRTTSYPVPVDENYSAMRALRRMKKIHKGIFDGSEALTGALELDSDEADSVRDRTSEGERDMASDGE